MPGGINLCGGQLLLQQLQQPACMRLQGVAAPHSATLDSKVLSMTCDVQGPITASSPSVLAVAAHPEVLLCPPRPGQETLLGKLCALRASLGLCYSWAGLLCYNALSRKQLAVAAVTSYPFVFDPVAGESAWQGASTFCAAAAGGLTWHAILVYCTVTFAPTSSIASLQHSILVVLFLPLPARKEILSYAKCCLRASSAAAVRCAVDIFCVISCSV
jgi:hypothetical protein